ncbi:MAG: NUDIX hydrolase [Granulosicoccus sp.]|nr:NUDIX hydrolase [Granulosicoccus sp.]
MRASIISLVESHIPYDKLEAQHTQDTLAFVQSNSQCIERSNLAGHVTASAWILSNDQRDTLLTHHRKLDRWFQPGGHIEEDSTIQAAALREAVEESGINEINLVSSEIFDIDVHRIPEKDSVPTHFHYDLRFLMIAENRQYRVSNESHDLAWIPLSSFDEHSVDESILRMARKSSEL